MRRMKEIGILALVLILATGLLASCSGESSSDESSSGENVIKVAASPEPHAVILNSDAVKDALGEEGWEIEVEELDDFIQPNVATTNGDVDANYFQHAPYLDKYNEENGTDLVAVANIHFEPMRVYPGTKGSFDALEAGDVICIPDDATNKARALLLLQECGVIKLSEDAGISATEDDVVNNPKNIELEAVEAAAIPAYLEDHAMGVVNANYAYAAELNIDEAIAAEDETSLAADTYVNVIAVREENKDSEKTQALVAALQSDEVRQFIEETFGGAVVAKF